MKILFMPDTGTAGTAERIPNLKRILSKRHSIIGVRPVALKGSSRSRFLKFIERVYEPLKLREICSHLQDIDLIFASQNRYALPARMIAEKLKRPLVFDSHGNPELLCANMNAGPVFRMRNVYPERKLLERARRIITVSEIDKAAYVKMGFAADGIDVIPTCINFDEVRITSKKQAREELWIAHERPIVLFFAAYTYAPNMEAVRYINTELAPAIPHADIFLAGRGDIRDEHAGNVTYKGFVEDLGLLISAADICIAPIWHGVGILEKVLQMMAYAKPTVVTPFAKLGIPELDDGRNCFFADTKEAFTQKVASLLEAPDSAQQTGENGAKLISERYNWPLYEEQLFRAIERS